MEPIRWPTLLFVTMVGFGCGILNSSETGEPGPVNLTVQSQTFAPGDSVGLQLENQSNQSVGVNLCSSTLQRRVNGEWARPDPWDEDRNNDGVNEACRMILNSLEPDAATTTTLLLPLDLEAGTYRFETTTEIGETERRIRTNPFRVGK